MTDRQTDRITTPKTALAYARAVKTQVHVTRLGYWQGNGLAIHSSRVRVLAGHHCVVVLGKLLTPVCLCHQAKQYNLVPAKRVISLAGKVTAGLVKSNGSLPSGL